MLSSRVACAAFGFLAVLAWSDVAGAEEACFRSLHCACAGGATSSLHVDVDYTIPVYDADGNVVDFADTRDTEIERLARELAASESEIDRLEDVNIQARFDLNRALEDTLRLDWIFRAAIVWSAVLGEVGDPNALIGNRTRLDEAMQIEEDSANAPE